MKLPSGIFKMAYFLAVIRRGSVRPCCGNRVAKPFLTLSIILGDDITIHLLFKSLAYFTFKMGLAALNLFTENEAKLFYPTYEECKISPYSV